MLVQTLRELEASGLVTRRNHGTVPPAVDYSVTKLGWRFVEPIDLLYDWARANADALDDLVSRPTSTRRRGAFVEPSGKSQPSTGPEYS
jgi:DNA-binding HxlR family transcriptional regulator